MFPKDIMKLHMSVESVENTQFELNALAEDLLERVVKKASVLPEGVGIPIFSHKEGACEHIYLFLTKHGLVEQKHQMDPPEGGMPYDAGRNEYHLEPSYHLVQRYIPSEEELEALEKVIHRLEAKEPRPSRRK